MLPFVPIRDPIRRQQKQSRNQVVRNSPVGGLVQAVATWTNGVQWTSQKYEINSNKLSIVVAYNSQLSFKSERTSVVSYLFKAIWLAVVIVVIMILQGMTRWYYRCTCCNMISFWASKQHSKWLLLLLSLPRTHRPTACGPSTLQIAPSPPVFRWRSFIQRLVLD